MSDKRRVTPVTPHTGTNFNSYVFTNAQISTMQSNEEFIAEMMRRMEEDKDKKVINMQEEEAPLVPLSNSGSDTEPLLNDDDIDDDTDATLPMSNSWNLLDSDNDLPKLLDMRGMVMGNINIPQVEECDSDGLFSDEEEEKPKRERLVYTESKEEKPKRERLVYTESEDEKPKKKAVKTVEKRHEQINAATALWTQSKSKLKDEDYNNFYKTISQDSNDPMLTIHTKTEGVNEYTTLFYIPQNAPFDMYRADYQSGIKLYVKRVFITDDDRELLPTYLRFVRGIIDSEDLPLNVSREILQENRILANIKQSSVKKILSEIKKLSKDEEKYSQFISQYNRALKEGVYQDYTNKESILELLRYKSTADEKKLTSLEDYKQRANSEQKAIYYIVGDNEKVLRNSPLLESYKKNNIEVLILDDKEIDEIITPTIGAFKEWQFTDITTAEAPKVEVNEEEKQKIEEEFKDIVSKIKDKLGSEVKDVKITSRLDSFASCITKDAQDAQMAAMAHMFRAMGQEAPEIKPILEINPNHEIVKKLQSSTNDELIEDVSWILLDLAKISEGVDVSDKVAFAKRLTKITSLAM